MGDFNPIIIVIAFAVILAVLRSVVLSLFTNLSSPVRYVITILFAIILLALYNRHTDGLEFGKAMAQLWGFLGTDSPLQPTGRGTFSVTSAGLSGAGVNLLWGRSLLSIYILVLFFVGCLVLLIQLVLCAPSPVASLSKPDTVSLWIWVLFVLSIGFTAMVYQKLATLGPFGGAFAWGIPLAVIAPLYNLFYKESVLNRTVRRFSKEYTPAKGQGLGITLRLLLMLSTVVFWLWHLYAAEKQPAGTIAGSLITNVICYSLFVVGCLFIVPFGFSVPALMWTLARDRTARRRTTYMAVLALLALLCFRTDFQLLWAVADADKPEGGLLVNVHGVLIGILILSLLGFKWGRAMEISGNAFKSFCSSVSYRVVQIRKWAFSPYEWCHLRFQTAPVKLLGIAAEALGQLMFVIASAIYIYARWFGIFIKYAILQPARIASWLIFADQESHQANLHSMRRQFLGYALLFGFFSMPSYVELVSSQWEVLARDPQSGVGVSLAYMLSHLAGFGLGVLCTPFLLVCVGVVYLPVLILWEAVSPALVRLGVLASVPEYRFSDSIGRFVRRVIAKPPFTMSHAVSTLCALAILATVAGFIFHQSADYAASKGSLRVFELQILRDRLLNQHVLELVASLREEENLADDFRLTVEDWRKNVHLTEQDRAKIRARGADIRERFQRQTRLLLMDQESPASARLIAAYLVVGAIAERSIATEGGMDSLIKVTLTKLDGKSMAVETSALQQECKLLYAAFHSTAANRYPVCGDTEATLNESSAELIDDLKTEMSNE